MINVKQMMFVLLYIFFTGSAFSCRFSDPEAGLSASVASESFLKLGLR